MNYMGHPFFDIGLATITAFAEKSKPEDLEDKDLEKIASYMQKNYIINPLKSFLSVVFTNNSGFSQPAYEKQPEKRAAYAKTVFTAYKEKKTTSDKCVFTQAPAIDVSFDVKGELPAGKAYRQHVPLTTGEDVLNFYPYGSAGLPLSGAALLVLHALPLGCAKVGGKLLGVHSEDPVIMNHYARHFLQQNLKLISAAQTEKSSKLAESPRSAKTLLMETFLAIETSRIERNIPSISAYHFSNSGQGVSLDIYHLPMEIMKFLVLSNSGMYRQHWNTIVAKGWQIVKSKKAKQENSPQTAPRFNQLYEDVFALPDRWQRFVRTYLLRVPERRKDPTTPVRSYSFRNEPELISWKFTEMFLQEVVDMNKDTIQRLRTLGSTFADYVIQENDRRFFQTFLTAKSYGHLRSILIKACVTRMKKGDLPLITFDPYVEVFEEGEDLPYSNWRLTRDLLLIRMIEVLHEKGWIQAHAEEIPEPEDQEEQFANAL